jgi:hypothetical protein
MTNSKERALILPETETAVVHSTKRKEMGKELQVSLHKIKQLINHERSYYAHLMSWERN